jgi:molecular chaperone DnaK (HSP70)
MKVGIDFGTTHTVAAVVDGSNYPVASFEGVDTWPSVVAADTAGELRFGLDAAAVRHEPGWSMLRSFKRLLNDAGPRTEVGLAGRSYRLAGLFTSFLAQLKRDLQDRSNTALAPGERIEAAISVPANASSAHVADLSRRPVDRREGGPDVEERYVLTAGGAVQVTLATRPTGLTRTFQLTRPALAGP